MFLWWKIFSFLQKNRKNQPVLDNILFLQEVKDLVDGGAGSDGEFELEQVLLLNLKSYLANGTFVLVSDSPESRNHRKLIELFYTFLNYLTIQYREKTRKGQSRQAYRILKHAPTNELNSIFWIMTQCKAKSCYIRNIWKPCRKSDGSDPYYIAPSVSVGILRFGRALEMCLQSVRRFVFDKDNFPRSLSMEFLPPPEEQEGEEQEGEGEGEGEAHDSGGGLSISDTLFNFYFL